MDVPRLGVGAIVVRDETLLMVRRDEEPARGLWSVPGGHVESGEYLQDAVRREVKEETGLDVEVDRLVGIFEILGDPHYVILDFLARPAGDEGLHPSGDAAEARWVPFDEVTRLECTPRLVETLRGWGVLPG